MCRHISESSIHFLARLMQEVQGEADRFVMRGRLPELLHLPLRLYPSRRKVAIKNNSGYNIRQSTCSTKQDRYLTHTVYMQ